MVLRLQEASVYGYQFIRGYLKKDLMSTSEPSSFLLFIGFFSFLVVTLGSSIPRHQCPIGTPSASTFWIHFQFYLFFTFLSMATESWQTQCVFSNCSGLLRCLKQGSRQFTTIFTRLASENMDLQVVRCMDQTRLRNEIKTNFLTFFFLNSGNCQNAEISVCTFQFYKSPYKYGRTFTHDTNSCFQSFHFPYILPFLLLLLFFSFFFIGLIFFIFKTKYWYNGSSCTHQQAFSL